MARIGDRYIFHADDGRDFNIEIINANDYREPCMKYGCDVYDNNGKYAGDVLFFGDDFLSNCEKAN